MRQGWLHFLGFGPRCRNVLAAALVLLSQWCNRLPLNTAMSEKKLNKRTSAFSNEDPKMARNAGQVSRRSVQPRIDTEPGRIQADAHVRADFEGSHLKGSPCRVVLSILKHFLSCLLLSSEPHYQEHGPQQNSTSVPLLMNRKVDFVGSVAWHRGLK